MNESLGCCSPGHLGIDCNADAIEDGNECVAMNNVSNVSYHCVDLAAPGFLKPDMLPAQDDVVIVNPPRIGLHPRFLALLKSVRT